MRFQQQQSHMRVPCLSLRAAPAAAPETKELSAATQTASRMPAVHGRVLQEEPIFFCCAHRRIHSFEIKESTLHVLQPALRTYAQTHVTRDAGQQGMLTVPSKKKDSAT